MAAGKSRPRFIRLLHTDDLEKMVSKLNLRLFLLPYCMLTETSIQKVTVAAHFFFCCLVNILSENP